MSKLTVFKASAGSGKTFQLALYYLTNILSIPIEGDSRRKLIVNDNAFTRHREILAITFTNKATEEMKARIINALREVADLKAPSAYRTALLSIIKTDAVKLAAAARKALSMLLFDYGNIHISTIDSFFQSVLRSFAYEADLSGNYELTLDGKQLHEMAIADTLASAAGMKTGKRKTGANRTELRDWLHRFLKQRIADCKDITLFDSQSSLRKDFAQFMKELSGDIYNSHYKQLAPFFNRPGAMKDFQTVLSKKLDEITKDNIKIGNELMCSLDSFKNVQEFIRLVSEGRYKNYTKSNLAYIHTDFENSKIFNKKVSNDDAISLRSKFDRMLANCKLQLTINAMLEQVYSLGLFNEVMSTEREIKQQQNTILLSDTTSLLHGIIDDCPTPFIYERIGQRLHHFLIDEFQDTSSIQWQNISPLVTESLSSGNDNLIIGDVKQCIYRFRNSDPSLLDSRVEDELSDYVNSPTLDKNFRSSPIVVNFNCELFRELALEKGFESSYSTVWQSAVNEDLDGYVNLAGVTSEEEALERMIQQMQRQLDPKEGGYAPRDIVVLTRTNPQARKVVDRLISESREDGALPGITVLSDEALYVNNSRAVRFIIDKLRDFSRLKTNDNNQREISQRTSTSERDLEWMTKTLITLNSQGIEGEQALTEMLALFDKESRHAPNAEDNETLRELAKGRSLFELVEQLVTLLPDPKWAEEEALYISAFQDLVLEFCRYSAPGVNNFLNLWDSTLKANAAIGLSAGVNAIRVMTIHKSKGLEFPCVHIPFLNDSLEKEIGVKWFDAEEAFKHIGLNCVTPRIYPIKIETKLEATFFKEQYQTNRREGLLDAINVMYVAFTRAVNELSISMKLGTKQTLPINVIGPILSKMTGTELTNKEPWECNFGHPTIKPHDSTESTVQSTDTIDVDSYDITHREKELWSFTEPATEIDSDF